MIFVCVIDGFDLFVSIFAARKSKVTLQLRRLAPSETVGSIKQRVLKETGISIDAQRLMWNQETLDDERTVHIIISSFNTMS